ncbi:FG-GAP repeat domain-containing protein [Bauldia sp.]|uniref:FG-GAP repeat domain-containing protein n=1 Tax=Bauldia sp. TaxID=2575872 RepID=UPI003BAB4221
MPTLSLALLIAAAVASVSPAHASAWIVERLNLPGPVTELRQDGPAVYVKAGGWIRLEACDGGICRADATPPAISSAPDGIPHGAIATGTGNVTEAWYAEPTDRYGHGVLGDRIEGGALTVIAGGERLTHRLHDDHVFEDLTPRIVDLDGDGAEEVVTIRANVREGAGLAVYGAAAGRLSEVAATPTIGRANRWLNVAGIADYSGDGSPDIAIVVTPHIGGRLEFWTLDDGGLERLDAARGFSNHAIGSTELALSATVDIDEDGVLDLVVPDAKRTILRFVAAKDGRILDLGQVPLGGRAATAIGVIEQGDRPVFLLGLENGVAVAVRASD